MSAKQPAQWLQEQFDQVHAASQGKEPDWLVSFRESAWTRFCDAGWPTKKYEEWQYISLRGLSQGGFAVGARGDAGRVSEAQLAGFDAPVSTHRMVFVDGIFQAELSALPEVKGGVVSSLQVALKGEREGELHDLLGRLLDSRVKNPLTYLNMALFEDGAFVDLPANGSLEQPLEIFHLSTAHREAPAFHPRSVFRFGQSAEAQIVERFAALEGDKGYWMNPAAAFFVGDNAKIEHTRIQEEASPAHHISQMHIEQGADSRFQSNYFALGATNGRHEIEAVIGGSNVSCQLNGLYLAGAGQHHDNRICMEHAKPHCTSDQYYKGIAAAGGSGAFSGKILVQQEAQKTDAFQTHQSLLLSDDSAIYSKPQLEIYADDVKCSHGATSGNIDANALFYLRSRGIPKLQAEQMLVFAFAQEIVDRVSHEGLQEQLTAKLGRRLGQMQEQLA